MVKLMIVHGMQQVMFNVYHWVLHMRMMVTQQILHAVFVVVAPEGSNPHHHQFHHQYQHNHHPNCQPNNRQCHSSHQDHHRTTQHYHHQCHSSHQCHSIHQYQYSQQRCTKVRWWCS